MRPWPVLLRGEQGGYQVNGDQNSFPLLSELIAYFSSNPLSGDGDRLLRPLLLAHDLGLGIEIMESTVSLCRAVFDVGFGCRYLTRALQGYPVVSPKSMGGGRRKATPRVMKVAKEKRQSKKSKGKRVERSLSWDVSGLQSFLRSPLEKPAW
jgi:hypothetical protein